MKKCFKNIEKKMRRCFTRRCGSRISEECMRRRYMSRISERCMHRGYMPRTTITILTRYTTNTRIHRTYTTQISGPISQNEKFSNEMSKIQKHQQGLGLKYYAIGAILTGIVSLITYISIKNKQKIEELEEINEILTYKFYDAGETWLNIYREILNQGNALFDENKKLREKNRTMSLKYKINKLETDLRMRTKLILPWLTKKNNLSKQEIKDILDAMNYEKMVKLITQRYSAKEDDIKKDAAEWHFDTLNNIGSVLDDYLLLENMKRKQNGIEPLQFHLKFIGGSHIHHRQKLYPLINRIPSDQKFNTNKNDKCGSHGLYYANASTNGFYQWEKGRHYYAIVHTSHSEEECICFDSEQKCRAGKILLGTFMKIDSPEGIKKLSRYIDMNVLESHIRLHHPNINYRYQYYLILRSLDYSSKEAYVQTVINLINNGKLNTYLDMPMSSDTKNRMNELIDQYMAKV